MITQIKRTEVDLAGLMRVLGEALYSTPRVAIRELVQNAHDSYTRRRLESGAELAADGGIHVSSDPAAPSITITDRGAGLTDDEIERYLATVGRGYTRELRDKNADQGLIGYFGLGFLSTFVIASSTEVRTCSYKTPEQAWLFTTADGQRYSIEPCAEREVGTEVKLTIAEAHRELADPGVLRHILRRYCALLPREVTLNGESVMMDPPPWRLDDSHSAISRKKHTLAWASFFEPIYEPLCCFELDEPDLELHGVLWVQDGGSYASSDTRHVSVFVRGMLISDDERDLLPPWAGFCGAVLESHQLDPTASRETLQKNDSLERAKAAVKKHLVAGLARLEKQEPAVWSRVLRRHNEALLGAALSEPALFELVADAVTLPTSEGDLTVPEILNRSRGALHLGTSEKVGFGELLFRALKVPVIDAVRYAAAPFAMRYADTRRGRVVQLGTPEADGDLFRETALDAEDQAAIVGWFHELDAQPRVADFEPATLPFVVVPDEDVIRKRRIEKDDADRKMSDGVLRMARMFTARTVDEGSSRLFVNGRCELITQLLRSTPARREQGLAVLLPLTTLLAHGATPAGDIEAALTALCSGLMELLQEGT